jgi:HEAT repeat protein
MIMSEIETEDTAVWAQALSSKDGVSRQSAREDLVAMGRAATPILIQLVEDGRSMVRWEAALALKDISDPAAVDALVVALRDEEGDVRWVAAEALAGIGKASLIPLLRSLTEHADSFELRDSAPVVIGFLQDPGLREMLEPVHEALRDGGTPEAVIAEAGEALEVLEGRGTGLA